MVAPLRLGSFALHENEISRHIVQCAIEVHRNLGGPGQRYLLFAMDL